MYSFDNQIILRIPLSPTVLEELLEGRGLQGVLHREMDVGRGSPGSPEFEKLLVGLGQFN